MNAFELQKDEMYRLLEIYDGFNQLQGISKSLIGYSYSSGYDEGILGKLAYIVDIIISRANPSLFNKSVDFSDTELARILNDREMDNRLKAEILLGIRV